MTDSDSLDRRDSAGATDTTARDPDRNSTWNTIDGTVDVAEVLDKDDLQNFFVEQIPDPLDPNASPDE